VDRLSGEPTAVALLKFRLCKFLCSSFVVLKIFNGFNCYLILTSFWLFCYAICKGDDISDIKINLKIVVLTFIENI
jgi:hypothetical protein